MKPARRLRAVTKPEPKPIGGLMDPRFQYVPAAATNIRATFERIREQQAKQARTM
ncbi:hypothetical protein [Xenophilus sp. Marseille-Q4582]|uniref:hypothetical protein n=1 Tax=Xenophilus sp. Marseille-Q4582 TaxID=2866600 RepID=UPI001CE3F516|nr:hypothetical protein [Xenophilus sp. Marseille-Q4582]